MKKNDKLKYAIIVFLIAALAGMIYMMTKSESSENATGADAEETYTETEAIRTDILNTISSSSYVATALEETKTLHNTYYFEEIYFSENQTISAGENILKYTNGTYLVAPYNCVITEMSLPESGEVCTSKHYITIQATETLQMTVQVDEDELSKISVGQEANIEIESLEKTVSGYVTKIANTATYSSSGSKFKVTVEFENDGTILLGMSAKCSVVLEKAENVIAVAKEAVQESNNQKYVIIKDENGNNTFVQVETGTENDAYVEIKSGNVNEGNTVLIKEDSESSSSSNSLKMQRNFR